MSDGRSERQREIPAPEGTLRYRFRNAPWESRLAAFATAPQGWLGSEFQWDVFFDVLRAEGGNLRSMPVAVVFEQAALVRRSQHVAPVDARIRVPDPLAQRLL